MPSIALFPQTFTKQDEILRRLSDFLNFPVVTDDHILAGVADEYGVAEEKLRNSMYRKTSVFNQFTLEKERHINLMKIVIASRLLHLSPCIYVGFHVMLIPRKVTHVLKVLLADDKSERIKQAAGEGITERDAKRIIKQNDISLYIWTDFLFRKEAVDRSLHDMILPVGKESVERCVKLIVDMAHKTSVLETEESKQAVEDMLLAAQVEKALLQKGHKVEVSARRGDMMLEVNKSVFNFSGLANELTHIAREVPGIKGVEVVKGKEYDTSVYRGQHFELPSKVLLVDDERELIQTLSERLINRDVGSYAVFNGQQALDFIDEDKPEIMVLDLKMPGIDGIEVLRRTKNKNPEIEVIILTGHGTDEDRKTCLALGAFAYLQKPVDMDELSRTIREAHAKVRGGMR
jgi:two-component system, OmpR family, response regulator CpxR